MSFIKIIAYLNKTYSIIIELNNYSIIITDSSKLCLKMYTILKFQKLKSFAKHLLSIINPFASSFDFKQFDSKLIINLITFFSSHFKCYYSMDRHLKRFNEIEAFIVEMLIDISKIQKMKED